MRRLSAIILLTGFLMSIAGYYPIYRMAQEFARHEMREKIEKGIPDAELTPFAFSDMASIHWIRVGKEIRKEGILYDVVRISRARGKIVLHCLSDKREMALESRLESFMNDHSSTPFSTSVHQIAGLFNLNFIHEQATCVLISFSTELHTPETAVQQVPASVPVNIPTPPPETV